MEKFVTDLDKLLDEFENEDISNNIYEFSDSSGYNSLKTSIELYPADLPIERNISQISEINDITELPTPTCTETNIIDSVTEEYHYLEKGGLEQTEMTTDDIILTPTITDDEHNFLNLTLKNDLHIDFLSQSDQADTIFPKEADIILSHDDNPQFVASPTQCHVPPKKKLRPNSLFGLTSITTSEDNNIDPNSSKNTQYSFNTNLTPHKESPDSTLINKKSIKRPLSLNLISPEKSDINISNVEICEENWAPISDNNSNQSQEAAIGSPQLVPNEKVFQDINTNDNNVVNDTNEWQGIPIEELGRKEPMWIKDELTNNCMQCQLPFTMFRRRHHCRACGRLLCGKCCCWRMQLQFSSRFFPKDRVCAVCFQYLIRIEVSKKYNQHSIISNVQRQSSALKSSPQPPSLAVSPFSNSDNQSGSDSLNNSTMSKSVIFFDGIRPGGDLTEIEKSRIITPTKYQSSQTKFGNTEGESLTISREPPFINFEEFAVTLPPLVLEYKNKLVINSNSESIAQPNRIAENNPIILAITRNLHIHLEIIQLTFCTCTINHTHCSSTQQECEYDYIECWYFASIGLETIGCEEVVIILKKLPNENSPPIEIFQYYFQIYQRAYKNESKCDSLEMTIELFNVKNVNLKEWAGILHIRPSFQCLDKLPLPYSSFLFGILIHRWELPWAKILPLRLLLALGNQSRFYPCSIISDRHRPSVYVEISQTILQVISPIFSFSNNLEQGFIDPNSLPTVPGMWIHLLASQETIVQIPKLSYHALLDILSYRQSEFNTLALVACFSREADSHLVCCQNEDTCKYYSGAISIQHTERTVTGATMIIFVPCDNSTEQGASIVEDVLVVRLSLVQLSCVINSLKTMSNLILQWDSPVAAETVKKLELTTQSNNSPVSRSFIKLVWTDNPQYAEMTSIERPSLVTDETIQIAFLNLTTDENGTIKSHRVPSSLQDLSVDRDTLNNINLKFVWSRYHYYISGNLHNDSFNDDPLDVEDIIRKVSICFSKSLHPFLDMLRGLGLVNLGLRIAIDNETVHFIVGCSKKIIYSALTPDQSPTEDQDSNQSSYICPKMGNTRKFHSLSLCALPDICIESLNEIFVPFLYSQTSQISTGSMISELEFHIID